MVSPWPRICAPPTCRSASSVTRCRSGATICRPACCCARPGSRPISPSRAGAIGSTIITPRRASKFPNSCRSSASPPMAAGSSSRVAPDLDSRAVARIESVEGGFRLTLADGDTLNARRVVMAMGLLGHEHRPAAFDGLPRDLVSHSCEHTDSERYRGKRVAVIGSGQSACKSAALAARGGRRGGTGLPRRSRSGTPTPASAVSCARPCVG